MYVFNHLHLQLMRKTNGKAITEYIELSNVFGHESKALYLSLFKSLSSVSIF